MAHVQSKPEPRTETQMPTVFGGIPATALAEILAQLERRRYAPGDVIIAEGADPGDLYIVVDGSVEALVVDRQGVEHQVGRIGPGSTLGEMSLFTGQPAAATVRALTDTEAMVMRAEEFERVASGYPVVYRNLGTILATRLAKTNRLAVQESTGRLVAIDDSGAPPELPWALACSVAWHTRVPTLLLVVDDNPAESLQALARAGGTGGEGATLRIAPSVDALPGGSLVDEVEEQLRRFDHVLVLAKEHELARLAGPQLLRMSASAIVVDRGRPGGDLVGASERARSPTLTRETRVHPILPLVASDVDALRSGRLPNRSDGARALGSLARDIVGLQVGFALGAGSLRGYAHAGVLSVLERAGLHGDFVAGTSIGSAAAALYALGDDPDTLGDALDRCSRLILRPSLSRAGLLSNRALRRYLQEWHGGPNIEDVPVPLAIVAADLEEQREVVFRHGPLWLALMASFSVPGVFPALRIGGRTLVDGAILNPVPTNVVAAMGADVVVAVRLTSLRDVPVTEIDAVEERKKPPSALSVILRSLEVMQARIVTDPPETPTISITPKLEELPSAKLRHFSAGRRYVEAGAEAAEAALPRLAALLPWLRN